MNLQGKRIAVTGATGFLGRYIVKSLLKRGARVVAVVRNPDRVPQLKDAGAELRSADLCDTDSMARAFQGCDAVVSNAALFKISNRDWKTHFDTNITGTQNVMRAVHQAGIRRVVHVSSCAIYKSRVGARTDETAPQHELNDKARGLTIYSVSKAVSEQKAWGLAKELGLQLTCVRPSAIYGAYDPNTTQIFKRIWRWPVSVSVPGAKLPLVYAGDVAEAVASALENERSIGQSYNTAGDQSTLHDFYRAWKKSGLPAPVFALPIPIPFYRLEFVNDKAQNELGFRNRSFEEGLAETHQIESKQGL